MILVHENSQPHCKSIHPNLGIINDMTGKILNKYVFLLKTLLKISKIVSNFFNKRGTFKRLLHSWNLKVLLTFKSIIMNAFKNIYKNSKNAKLTNT